MATIDMADWAGDGVNHPAGAWAVRKPYLISRTIDLADVVTAKGSAIAQSDVIEVLDIPANTMILAGGAQKMTAMTGTSTDVTFDIGFTGGDVDNLVDGWDFDGAAVLSYATPLGIQEPVISTSADTLDILIVTQTGTITGGQVRVFALCVDVGDVGRAGIAALQS